MSSQGPIANLSGSSQQAGSKIPQHVLVVDSSGNPATFGGSGGTSATDSGSFTPTSTLGTPVMGAFETTPDTLTSGQLGIVALDTNRNLKVNVAAGGTAGVQYTQGDSDASITGTPVMFEGAADALVVPSSASPMPVQIGDGTDLATVRDVTGAKALDVSIVDGSGNQVTSFGGGTQYTEDAAAAADPVGNALIVVRDDARAGTLTSANGDNVALRGTNSGELYVKHVDAIPVTDNGGSLTVDGTVAVSGTVPVSDGGGSITVDGTVTANLAAGTNNIGDVDVLTLPALPAGTNNIGDVDVLTVPADPFGANADAASASGSISAKLRQIATNGHPVTGAAAHDAAVSGNPVLIAAEARSTDGTAVTSGDVVRFLATLLGKQVTYPWALPGSTWNSAAASGGITNTTGVTAKAAAGAGVRNYITQVQAINGHATVSTDVQIRDGASGTVLWRGFAQAAGGGCAAKFDPPLRGTANTLVEVACGTTGSATYVNLQGFTSAE